MLKMIGNSRVLLLFLLIFLTTSVLKAGEIDKENWTFLGGRTKLGNTKLAFHTANFFRHGEVGYFLNHTQISLDFHSNSKWSAGIGYKQEYVNFGNYWRSEYRPMLHLYYKQSWGNVNFRNRSRWEFRFIEGELIHRYRNQFQFTYTKFERIKPYFSTEFSFYFKPLDYTRQRTILGADIPIRKFDLDLFVGHQINEDFIDEWGTKFIMGTSLNYSF